MEKDVVKILAKKYNQKEQFVRLLFKICEDNNVENMYEIVEEVCQKMCQKQRDNKRNV